MEAEGLEYAPISFVQQVASGRRGLARWKPSSLARLTAQVGRVWPVHPGCGIGGNPRVPRPGARERPRATSSLATMATLVLIMLLALHGVALAHEQWVLTPEQMQEWDAKLLPDLFATWSPGNVIPILAFLAFLACWIRLGFTGARELFPDLQARLASHGSAWRPRPFSPPEALSPALSMRFRLCSPL
jgi:hypothetical protein